MIMLKPQVVATAAAAESTIPDTVDNGIVQVRGSSTTQTQATTITVYLAN
jgi:hypothetical protein